MESQSKVLLGVAALLVVFSSYQISHAYAESVILGDTESFVIVSDDDKFEEAILRGYIIDKNDIFRERVYDDRTTVFGHTVTGESVYIIYSEDLIKAKIWSNDGSVIRIIESAETFSNL